MQVLRLQSPKAVQKYGRNNGMDFKYILNCKSTEL